MRSFFTRLAIPALARSNVRSLGRSIFAKRSRFKGQSELGKEIAVKKAAIRREKRSKKRRENYLSSIMHNDTLSPERKAMLTNGFVG